MATAKPLTFSAPEMTLLKALLKANGSKTYGEIADGIDKTEGTVRQDLSKLRSKYKESRNVSIHAPKSEGGMGIPDVKKVGGRGAARSAGISVDDALAALSEVEADEDDDAESPV